MNELWSLIISWAPFLILIGVWLLLSRGYRQRMTEAAERSRETVELQTRILSCLEDIKVELKGLNAAKES